MPYIITKSGEYFSGPVPSITPETTPSFALLKSGATIITQIADAEAKVEWLKETYSSLAESELTILPYTIWQQNAFPNQ